MRRRSLFAFLLAGLLGPSLAHAQLVLSVRQGTTNVPHQSTFEFGSALVGTPISRVFTFTNIGTGNVNVTYSLGSNIFDPGRFTFGAVQGGGPVVPGGTRTFELIYESTGPGAVTNDVRLFLNGVPHFTFFARATATNPIGPLLRLVHGGQTVTQDQVFEFGPTGVGQVVQRTFEVHNDGDQNLSVSTGISGNVNDPASFFVVSNLAGDVPPGGTSSLTLGFDAAGLGTVERDIDFFVNGTPRLQIWGRGITLPADFTLARSPASRQVVRGQSTTFTVSASGEYGFGSSIALSASGLPAGVTASFSPASIAAGGSSTVTVQTSPGSPVAVHTITFTGTGGGLTRSVTASLDIQPTGNFSIDATPASRQVAPGGAVTYTVATAVQNGFNQPITLSVSGLPAGTTASFQPNPVAAGASSTLTVQTSASTPTGARTLTISGAGGGFTRTDTVTLDVQPGGDFTLDATPSAATVIRGRATSYSVSVVPSGGFAGTVGLSVSGLPAGASAAFTPAAIAPGTSSTLTVTTTGATPLATSTLTISGTSGAATRTATVTLEVIQGPSGPPTLGDVTPEEIAEGAITRVTLTGTNLQGADIHFATEPAQPGDPTPAAFPAVTVVSGNTGGTTLEVDVDTRDAAVSGFYTIVAGNEHGEAGQVLRVLGIGPEVDAWTPAEPSPGRVYSLILLGDNLAGATVSVTGGGVSVHGVTSDDRQLNGYLEVAEGANLGPRTLTVSNHGRQVQLTIQVVASAGLSEENVLAEAAQRAALLQPGRLVPEVYLQELTLGEGLSFSRSDQTHGTVPCFITLGWNIYSYSYTVALPFDPLTGRIRFDVLRDLQLGIPIPVGVELLSAFADLILQVRFNCFPVSHLQVCIYGFLGFEIPGLGGQIFQAGGCFQGGVFFPVFSTSGSLGSFGFETDNQCSTVTPTTGLPSGGFQEAEVTPTACCPENLRISAHGRAFPGTVYSWDWAGQDVPITPITVDDPACGNCPCGASVTPLDIQPGQTKSLTFTVSNPSSSSCSYNWSLQRVDGGQITFSPSSGAVTVPATGQRNVTVQASVPEATSGAHPMIRVTAQAPVGDSQPCGADFGACLVPTGEDTVFLEWIDEINDLAIFRGDPLPRTVDWSNQVVSERPGGAGTVDTCYFDGGPIPRPATDATVLSNSDFTLVAGGTYRDTIGITGNLQLMFEPYLERLPCHWRTTQSMKRVCPDGRLVAYKSHSLRVTANPTGAVVCREYPTICSTVHTLPE
jgi:hypothetical protein